MRSEKSRIRSEGAIKVLPTIYTQK